jgi:hypothetical protein
MTDPYQEEEEGKIEKTFNIKRFTGERIKLGEIKPLSLKKC